MRARSSPSATIFVTRYALSKHLFRSKLLATSSSSCFIYVLILLRQKKKQRVNAASRIV